MRGNFRWIVSSASPAGSSPLMRGKLDAELSAQVDDGLIPAYAGKTARASRARRFCRAHPHSHGENKQLLVAAASQRGSSPLTRGKREVHREGCEADGLIPTHAGKTPSRGCPRRIGTAHPHSRGENTSPAGATGLSQGSSPLTRGKHGLRASVRENAGLIPAHAGKTRLSAWHPSRPWAHPRSRGENLPLVFLCTLWWGSSPLTRGKRRHNPATTAVVGLIPTHAGSTSWMQGSRPTCGAHPHSRGENSATSLTDEEWEGSSPLTRGKRSEECCGVHDVGLIPTDAGKTH